MRFLFVVMVVAAGALIVRSGTASATPYTPQTPTVSAESQSQTVSDNDSDDDVVEVQLLVAGIAAFVVVGLGTGAYFLRKRLGLVPGPPEQAGGGHH